MKVRTGCITCKACHIKCDERRPHCNNCVRSRRHCTGYTINSTKTLGPVQICCDSKQNIYRPDSGIRIRHDVRLYDFRESMGMLYFEQFVGLMRGPWISAASNTELWQEALPQLTRSNSTLRCIAIAIGALCVSQHQADGSDTGKRLILPRPKFENDTHYQNAVRYYCFALICLSENNNIQDEVSSSILLLFLEDLWGNRKTALNHLNHGLSLMLTLFMDDPHNYASVSRPKPWRAFCCRTLHYY